MTSITLKNVTKVYGSGDSAVVAVGDVTLHIPRSEFFFLLGPSGCGKTTLLRIIAGLVRCDAGKVFFDDRDVTDLAVERRLAAMVFQNYALWPHMTVARNVEFGPRMRRRGRRAARQIAAANLERVRMADLARRKPNQLSGGQQQRVALARALAAEGDCVLLDEPLSNLDAQLRMQMRDELRTLVKETGITAVYVTHDQKEALSMADRIAVMNEGRIVQIGRPEALYNRPATYFVADFLGEANFLPGKVTRVGAPVHVATAVGTLLAAGPAAPAGTAVLCCVRPERTGIAAAQGQVPHAPEGTVRATVLSTTYLGDLRQYTCQVHEVQWKVSVLSGGQPPFSPGTDVILSVDPEDVSLLPG